LLSVVVRFSSRWASKKRNGVPRRHETQPPQLHDLGWLSRRGRKCEAELLGDRLDQHQLGLLRQLVDRHRSPDADHHAEDAAKEQTDGDVAEIGADRTARDRHKRSENEEDDLPARGRPPLVLTGAETWRDIAVEPLREKSELGRQARHRFSERRTGAAGARLRCLHRRASRPRSRDA
jgi:hypothetical protein